MFRLLFKSPKIHRTPLYRAKAAYQNMYRRCGNRCGTEPAYKNVKLLMTLDEWLKWSIPRYRSFIRRYPDQSPSVSRKEDKGHYKIGNIEIVSLKANRKLMKTPGQEKNGIKRCSSCKKKKSVNHYTKNKISIDGYAHQCRDCRRIQQLDYNSKPENKEKRRIQRRNKYWLDKKTKSK